MGKNICEFHGWVHDCKESRVGNEDTCYWHTLKFSTELIEQKERIEKEGGKPPDEFLEKNNFVLKNIIDARKEGRDDFCGANFQNMHMPNYDFTKGGIYPFSGLKLVEADFSGANLEGADFTKCNLWRAKFYNAKLKGAKFNDTQLMEARFDNADLDDVSFDRAFLRATNFSDATLINVSLVDAHFNNSCFESCKWDKNYINKYERNLDFKQAKETYSKLKHACQEFGDNAVAAHFFYREQECIRKSSVGFERISHTMNWLFWGYGDKPFRLIATELCLGLFFAMIYYFFKGLYQNTILDSIYYSFVSLTALGYGGWVKGPTTWVQIGGVIETIIGVVLFGLFVTSITRKLNRF